MSRKTGEYLVSCLEAYGVEYVFGIPGVHTVELYRGLKGSRIRHVTPRHEQGAGFMADGYARASGKPGVAWVITGPGLTNIATAVSQARQDSIPMLVISSVNRTRDLGRRSGALHELSDQRQVATSLFVESHRLHDVAQFPDALAQAFASFEGARPGPVHIELPIDLLTQPTAAGLPTPTPHLPMPVTTPAAAALQRAAEMLDRARKPIILAGGGARWAAEELRAVAEALGAPVVMTTNARGLLPVGHPLAVSASPSLPAVREAIRSADLVFAVGTELGRTDYDMYGDGGFVIASPLIRIDIDPQQLHRNASPELALAGDAAQTLAALRPLLARDPLHLADQASAIAQAARKGLNAAMARQVEILEIIRDTLPGVRMVGDSTQAVYAGNLYFEAGLPGGWFNSATGFGTLGYGLPAAIGAKLGDPDAPVVALIGDGGIQFTLGEIGSALDAGVPVIILVWNNQGYGEIKSYMIEQGIEPEGVDLTTPDFVALAQAYGMEAERVAGRVKLEDVLVRASARSVPSLIELDEMSVMTRR